MENLREVVGAADLHFKDVVKTTIYWSISATSISSTASTASI
jgi:hypothetical protein